MAPRRYESEKKDVAPLGKPLNFEFAKKTAQNRFLKGAMTERLSSWDAKNLEARGIPSKNLINVYKRWGEGEYGVILTGNIMIEYDHRKFAFQCEHSTSSNTKSLSGLNIFTALEIH
jgi:2,4-dienoyl-CoA reductase-like NADH-dependent reductase (Old Yellow Enzyme family)